GRLLTTYFRVNIDVLVIPKDANSRILFFLISIILTTTLVIAVIAPTNNWDSMTYHMTRVAYWIQNGSIYPYFSHDPRQISFAPFAEYCILFLSLLAGTDFLANLPQWLSFVGLGFLAFHQTTLFGLSKKNALTASILVWTLPMGIMQSTTTQNDLVTAFWIMNFVVAVFSVVRSKHDLFYILWAGMSLGLAFITKGTAYVYSLPFICYWIYHGVRSAIILKTFRPVLKGFLAIAIVVAIIFPQHYRNMIIWNHPLGEQTTREATQIENPTWKTFATNIWAHASVHFGTPSSRLNNSVRDTIVSASNFLPISIDDPIISFNKASFGIPRMTAHEDVLGNMLHCILIFMAILFFGTWTNYKQSKMLFLLTITTFFLLAFLIKWQLWLSRIHLSFFILMSVPLALFIHKSLRRWRTHILFLITLSALPWVFGQKGRPILKAENIFNKSRNELYFFNRRWLTGPYLDLSEKLSRLDCKNIGLYLPIDSYEYPFFALNRNSKFTTILHPNNPVSKKSLFTPIKNSQICLIIAIQKKKALLPPSFNTAQIIFRESVNDTFDLTLHLISEGKTVGLRSIRF
ncbi:glycosyltransferase family 39 protein, partial [Bacteriovoracaceae bacterium]|nr:glycosyltransferase family 39 protein [Bacteriovoracaceae bacterium]